MVKSSIQKFSEFFSGTKQEVFSFLAKKGRVVKTVFLLSTGGFYGKQLSSKVFWFLVMFVPRATIYCFFSKKSPWSLLKLHSMCWQKHFDKNLLPLRKIKIYAFSSYFCQIFSRGVVKTTLYVTRGQFWGVLLELFQL